MSDLEIRQLINTSLYPHMSLEALAGGIYGHIYNISINIRDVMIYDRIPSSFVKACVEKNWEKAKYIADKFNKDTLNETTFFQDLIKRIETSSEYIQKIRETNISKLLEKE